MPNDPMMPPQGGPFPGGPPGGGSAPPQPQPYRQLKVEDALAYLDQVKMKFEKQPHIYNKVRPRAPRANARLPTARRPRALPVVPSARVAISRLTTTLDPFGRVASMVLASRSFSTS